VLKVNLPNDIDVAIAMQHQVPKINQKSTREEREQAAAELSAFLEKYRHVLQFTKISKEAKMPDAWAYNVEKAARAGAIRPDRAQLFVDIASKILMQKYGKG
jgi:hypothetical protein